jgi:hypothetical protein
MLYEYNTKEQIDILQRMSNLSTILSQFELTGKQDSKDYEEYLKMLDNLEEILVELRENQNKNT